MSGHVRDCRACPIDAAHRVHSDAARTNPLYGKMQKFFCHSTTSIALANNIPDSQYYSIPPPAAHNRVVPLEPYLPGGDWYAIPASSKARTPMVGRSSRRTRGLPSPCTPTPTAIYGRKCRPSKYSAALGHILQHFSTSPLRPCPPPSAPTASPTTSPTLAARHPRQDFRPHLLPSHARSMHIDSTRACVRRSRLLANSLPLLTHDQLAEYSMYEP